MGYILKFFLFLVVPILSHALQPDIISVGIVSGPEDSFRQKMRTFWSMSNSTNIILEPEIEDIRWWGWQSHYLFKSVCSLLKTGVHNLVTSVSARNYPMMQSFAARYKLPLLTIFAPAIQPYRTRHEITMTPDSSAAIGDLLSFYKWKSFTFLYNEDDGPQKLQKLLEVTNHLLSVKALFRISSKEEAIRYLQLLQPQASLTNFRQANSELQCIILDTNEMLADEILTTLPTNIRIRQRFHFILINPVGVVQVGTQRRSWGNYLLTKLSLIDTEAIIFKDLENEWPTLPPNIRRNDPKFIPYSALIWRDVQEVLNMGFTDLAKSSKHINFTRESINCMQTEQRPLASTTSSVTSDYLKKVVIPSAVTGKIQFSQTGERVNYKFNIFEITATVNKKTGTWTPTNSLNIENEATEQNKNDGNKNGIKPALRQKISVITILHRPYMILKNDSKENQGNDRYEGYLKDVLDAVFKVLDWDYELSLVKDSRYGSLSGNNWTGIVGELIRKEADVGLADLTINSIRESVIDFSKPFITFGLNILMKKPDAIDVTATSIGMLGFIKVWSYDIWLLVTLFYFVLGGVMFGVSHFIGEPDRIRSLDTKLSDKLSFCSSFWFVLGSLVFRSTGIYPRSLSHRILTIIWWAFSLFLLVIYISSLAFTIISERSAGEDFYTKDSFDIMRNAVEKGQPKIGIIANGSTHEFFRNSRIGLYKDFGNYLLSNEDVLVYSKWRGVKRVVDSNGAFVMIMESPTTHYYSSIQPCKTTVSTGFLDHKAFGLAFSKGSTLKEPVDHALINLREAGVLRQLYEKWWHLQSQCEDPNLNALPSLYSNSLTLKEVSGLFCFLLAGMLVAATAGISEYFIQSKRLSVDK